MKKLLVIGLFAILGVTMLQAQSKNTPRLTPEQFRAKQEAYIIKKADLTQQEAQKFFPVFFELQDKKKELNNIVWKLMREGKKEPLKTEAEYNDLLEKVFEVRIQTAQLEKNYYQKFKKILPAQKLFKVQHAEMRFHRELLKEIKKESK